MNTALWAKKQEKDARLEWLPLTQHLEDTMQVMGLLWEHWMSEGMRRFIMQSLSIPNEDCAKSLVKFLGAVHDIGKATPAFQIQTHPRDSKDLQDHLMERLERIGFQGIRELLLESRQHHTETGEFLLRHYGVNEGIASIVGAHHGKPLNEGSIQDPLKSYTKFYRQVSDLDSEVSKLWEKTQFEILEWALQKSGFQEVGKLPTVKQPAQVLLSGLVIMADWIASNDKFFPLIPVDQLTVEDPEERMINGWTAWHKTDAWQAEHETVKTLFAHCFETAPSFEPNYMQKAIYDTIESCSQPGIFILEAPMGLGKTEASLIGVELLAQKTSRSGLFFGLPTQATSDGIFPRIHRWLKNITDAPGEPLSIRLQHGKSSLNTTFQGIARNVDPDGEDGTVIANEWFAGPKTAALDDFVIGTVDQFLMAALKQKHLALRHLGFSKKVVVIDEVHAYDAYMSQYLYQAIQWMGAYGVPMIILSATLPAKKREAMIQEYMKGRGLKKREIQFCDGDITSDAYPLITYSDGDQVHQVREFEPGKEKRIEIRRLKEEQLIQTLHLSVDQGGVAGVIVNTVKRAQEIACQCMEEFGEDMVEVLHSGFIATHRLNKERQLMKLIGKNAKRPFQKIIIGTQVMEQSLDIDFDVLFTDLSPMDLLIQRIGRLHRHSILRPKHHVHPVTYVLGTSEEFEFEDGSKAVYGDYLLIRTQTLLKDQLKIPQDISTLVQHVYSDKDLEFPETLQSKYDMAKQKHDSHFEEKTSRAKQYRILKPFKPKKDSLHEWLKNEKLDGKGAAISETQAYAQVRDSEETIEVIVVEQIGDGYGIFGSGEDVSQKMDHFDVARNLAKETLKLPRMLTNYPKRTEHTIEVLEAENRKLFSAWQKQSWLKGALGILLDTNHQCRVDNVVLSYDEKLGLRYQKVECEQ